VLLVVSWGFAKTALKNGEDIVDKSNNYMQYEMTVLAINLHPSLTLVSKGNEWSNCFAWQKFKF